MQVGQADLGESRRCSRVSQRCNLFAAVLLFGLASGSIKAQDSTERMRRAEEAASIDLAAMKPWHLRMSFQTFVSKGVVADHGTIDEWWAPGRHRIVIASSSFTGTEVENNQGLFQTDGSGSVPYAIDQLRRGVVHPMPSAADTRNATPELREETFFKIPMDCVMLTQAVGIKGKIPFALFPTYCLERGKDTLRLTVDPGLQTLIRNRVGTFAGHAVAVDLTLEDSEMAVATGHVETLATVTPEEGDFENTTSLAKVGLEATPIGAGVMAGGILSKPNPVYPESARSARVSGVVTLRAIIGKNGHVRSLRVEKAPDAALAVASLQAVRHWTYRPYLLNGVPTEVDTTITVNFTLGPG